MKKQNSKRFREQNKCNAIARRHALVDNADYVNFNPMRKVYEESKEFSDAVTEMLRSAGPLFTNCREEYVHAVCEFFDFANCLATFVARGCKLYSDAVALGKPAQTAFLPIFVEDGRRVKYRMTEEDYDSIFWFRQAIATWEDPDDLFNLFVAWYYTQVARNRAMMSPANLLNFSLGLLSCVAEANQFGELEDVPTSYPYSDTCLRHIVHSFIDWKGKHV